ncbi:GntR family transcriptional regulator [Bacteroidia bacterium]|nr:GntR family transcriptional regulator [Bacteroidia bacterium]
MATKSKGLDISLLVVRIVAGGLMLMHGIHKLLHGFEPIKNMLHTAKLPEYLWIGVPLGEIVAPVLLILGICCRLSATLFFGTMLMSMYLAFGWHSFALTQTGGIVAELNILYAIVSFTIMLVGKGKYSLQKKDTWFWG